MSPFTVETWDSICGRVPQRAGEMIAFSGSTSSFLLAQPSARSVLPLGTSRNYVQSAHHRPHAFLRQLTTLIMMRAPLLLRPCGNPIRVRGAVVRSLQHEKWRGHGLIKTTRGYVHIAVRRHR